MTKARLEYHDPLYETITFEKGLPSQIGFLNQDNVLDPRSIIQTAEFARLAFLRKTELAWLMFPSATHTHFAHSIGCWGLGRLAESLIKIRNGDSQQTYSLSSWLKYKELRQEFYLSLLCHDIGQGPLNQTLEHNTEFISGLNAAGITPVDYGHRGVALLEGKGPLAEAWQQVARQRYGRDVKTFLDVMGDSSARDNKICMPAVYYFMTEDQKYLELCSHSHRNYLELVKDLVSGLLSLRRLDNYARDSYFTGLRRFSVNLRGFLGGLVIMLSSHSINETRFLLTKEATSYAANLLFGKRQSLITTFRSPEIIASQAMVNWALSTYLRDYKDHCLRANACKHIVLMEDDQFLETITSQKNPGCHYIGQRIRGRNPYCYVSKFSNTELDVERIESIKLLSLLVDSQDKNKPPPILLHFSNDFWNIQKQSEVWLDARRLFVEDTCTPLAEHTMYKNNFNHLQEMAKIKHLWIFSRDESIKEDIRQKISLVLDGKYYESGK